MSEKIDNFFSYLPINENNMRWDLYLTGVGLATVEAGDVYPPKGHPGVYNFRWESGRVLPEYQILLISAGTGHSEVVDFQVGDQRLENVTIAILIADPITGRKRIPEQKNALLARGFR